MLKLNPKQHTQRFVTLKFSKYTYFMRTIPGIKEYLKPLDNDWQYIITNIAEEQYQIPQRSQQTHLCQL